MFFFLIIRRLPRSTRTDTLLPYTTLFRSFAAAEPGNFGKLLADGTRRARIDAERGLADAEDRFDLRIAVETLRHRAHLAADLARRVMLTVPAERCALPMQLLPVLGESIGAFMRIDADLRLSVHRANRSLTIALRCRADKQIGRAHV